MLPRPQRLRSNQQFQRVYRSGRSWAHPLAVLHVLPAPSGRRLGVSVSKKVGNAVTRNRVRRRIRAIARELLPTWRQGAEAVVVARAAAADAEFAALAQALSELSRRARLPREPGEAAGAPYSMAPAEHRGRTARSGPAPSGRR
jgi:ribonuclease P protein component